MDPRDYDRYHEGYEVNPEWPYDYRPVYRPYDYQQDPQTIQEVLDQRDWVSDWFTMGMRELLFYLEKQARFAEYLRERGIA